MSININKLNQTTIDFFGIGLSRYYTIKNSIIKYIQRESKGKSHLMPFKFQKIFRYIWKNYLSDVPDSFIDINVGNKYTTIRICWIFQTPGDEMEVIGINFHPGMIPGSIWYMSFDRHMNKSGGHIQFERRVSIRQQRDILQDVIDKYRKQMEMILELTRELGLISIEVHKVPIQNPIYVEERKAPNRVLKILKYHYSLL